MKRRSFVSSLLALASAPSTPAPAPAPAPAPGPTPAPNPAPAPAPDHLADWIQRSTGPGVLVAHDLARDAELDTFVRPTTINGMVPLTLEPTPFGTRAVRSRGIGSRIMADVPSIADVTVTPLQWITVADAAQFPEPIKGRVYKILIGSAAQGGLEYVDVKARDLAGNRIQVQRRAPPPPHLGAGYAMDGIEGANWRWPAAPGYTASRGYSIGKGPDASWVRPLAALLAGANGKTSDDAGISNGAARKARTWNPAAASRHAQWREGYFGHRSYWDAKDAKFKDWLPRDHAGRAAGTRVDAFEGDEVWIQFRAFVSPSRFESAGGKMLYVQNAHIGGSGQFFWGLGAGNKGSPAPAGTGNALVPLTCYGDSAAPAGGALTYPQSAGGQPGAYFQNPSAFPLCAYDKPQSNRHCWWIPGGEWVTYLLHFKFGRDNSPLNPVDPLVGQDSGGASWYGQPDGWFPKRGPFPSATDPAFRTKFELFVARDGESKYTTITSRDDFTWFFGDGKWQTGYYHTSPPGLNAMWLAQELNQYLGSGSVAPPTTGHFVDYTQPIVSRNWIRPPLATAPAPAPAPVPALPAPGHIGSIGKNTLSDACGAGAFQLTHLKAVLNAWGSAATSIIRGPDGAVLDVWYWIMGGGHGDSGWNGLAVYKLFTGRFEQVVAPTTWAVRMTTDVVHGEDVSKPGMPESQHIYDNIVGLHSDEPHGPALLQLRGSAVGQGAIVSNQSHLYSPKTGWRRFANLQVVGAGSTAVCGFMKDTRRKRFVKYPSDNGNTFEMLQYGAADSVWTKHTAQTSRSSGSKWSDVYGAAGVYDPVRDLYIMGHFYGPPGYPMAVPADDPGVPFTMLRHAGDVPLRQPAGGGTNVGIQYRAAKDTFVVIDNTHGMPPQAYYECTPPARAANWATDPWVWVRHEMAGTSKFATAGTTVWNRFQYVAALDALIVCPRVDAPMEIWKLKD
jgi:hypothetical protein